MPHHLSAPNGAKRSYIHDLPPHPPHAGASATVSASEYEKIMSMSLDDKIEALTHYLGPPPPGLIADKAAPPAPLTSEQEKSAAIRRMGAPGGETSLEKKFQAKYERLAAVNGETAEGYARQIMRQAAERIYGSKQNLTNGPDGHGKILPLIQSKKIEGKAKRKLAKSMGKKKLSRWEDCYVDTLGSICGVPVLLIESLGTGEGWMEFEEEEGTEDGDGKTS